MIGFRTAVSPSVSDNKSSKSNVTTTPASVVGDVDAVAALVPSNLSSPLRTLDDVRDQVSQEIAINAITKAEYIDGKEPWGTPYIKCLLPQLVDKLFFS